jgi:FtsP/CotA-like multicopper oxidase with cupredoxin domain
MKYSRILPSTILLLLIASFTQANAVGVVRHYFVAADEVEWNYTPLGMDRMMNMPFTGYQKLLTEQGPHRIGSIYRKAIYREYTDATFTKLKPRPADQQYLGAVGPILRAEVGDTIQVLFKNNATHPYTMHPHGVFYDKASEGVGYNDGFAMDEKDGILPGHTHLYIWLVPERAGPGPNDPSSIVWLYHSHANEPKDIESGLIGAIIITRKAMARPDGRPRDVDREFVTLFMIYNENISWYLEHNIDAYASDPKGVNKSESLRAIHDGSFDIGGSGFLNVNFRNTINGYSFANGPVMTMKKGERVRWYVVTMGEGFNIHTPHWHGNTVLNGGHRTDVIFVSPAQMDTVDMLPDDPGIWMYHCHIDEHMEAGMTALYQVLP